MVQLRYNSHRKVLESVNEIIVQIEEEKLLTYRVKYDWLFLVNLILL